ncbi:MAG: archaetidylserine decarboxylase [Planctomycetota bacterium]
MRLTRIFQQEDINFLLTNRIPRRLATRFMGWFSRIESPLLTRATVAAWRWFAEDLDLSESKQSRFRSLHDCFTRQLVPGARPVDMSPEVVVSPCDAIVGAHGTVVDGMAFQAKGFPYAIADLLADPALVDRYRGGKYVTLRLKSSMYHRFHAPVDCSIEEVVYISGDTWNVNPIALARVEKLFCKNERAVLDLEVASAGFHLTLVPVAAILVASIHLGFLDGDLDLRYRGPNRIPAHAELSRGQEMGYFQHGSTILVFGSESLRFHPSITEGHRIRMGEPLFLTPDSPVANGRHEPTANSSQPDTKS